jgi:hypothetical protein
MKKIIHGLVKIAQTCDENKMYKEADMIDEIIVKLSTDTGAYMQIPVADVSSGKFKVPADWKSLGKNMINGVEHHIYLKPEKYVSNQSQTDYKAPDLGRQVLDKGLPWVAEKLTGRENLPGLLETFYGDT